MSRKPNSGRKTDLSQFGLLDIPDTMNYENEDNDDLMDLSDSDIDLEAELAGLDSGYSHRPKKSAPAPSVTLDAMIAESLKDVPSDEELSDDEDDPELLSELRALSIDDEEVPPPRAYRPAPPPPLNTSNHESSIITLLQDRITNYTLAEKNAKENGESSRARRFGRGLKTLNDLLKQAEAGRPIKDEDIPPAVSLAKPQQPSQPVPETNTSDSPPVLPPRITSLPSPSVPDVPDKPPSLPELKSPQMLVTDERQQGLRMILRRQQEFKAAALTSKHDGDKVMALEYLKVAKQFDMVIEAYKAGQEMDLNELPTPVSIASSFKSQQKGEEHLQNSSDALEQPSSEAPGLITASSVDEALKQRLAAFREQESKAKEQGNSSKARRMARIVKQYQEAIKLHAAGKPIPLDELPSLPGYAPIPTSDNIQPTPMPKPAPAPTPKPGSAPASAATATPRPQQATRYEKQIVFLLQRQKEFKEAAVKAKRAGNIEQAREYLRSAKGFDAVIEAARGGLAVDLKSLPLLPKDKDQLENTFDVVSADDCVRPDSTPVSIDDEDIFPRLVQQLQEQLRLCQANRDHYRAMGNIAETNRFENLAISVKQDLDLVKVAKRLGQNPPKFRYESKKFSVVQCNTDLNENDLELTIVRGIAYNVPNPKEVDTYVKFEFPYPQDAPVSDRTSLIKDTNSPEYNAVFPLVINRSARPCLRVFKRYGIKFEVYSRGGWFSRDTLLASLTVKLEPLQTQVTLHEAFPLMDGRRPAGGSLEIKLRVRTPLLQQQFDNTTHRWLVVDN